MQEGDESMEREEEEEGKKEDEEEEKELATESKEKRTYYLPLYFLIFVISSLISQQIKFNF